MSDEIELPAATKWVRVAWDEPDFLGPLADDLDSSSMLFLYEIGTDGQVLRAVELTGADLTPVGAASLAEFWVAQKFQQQPETSATRKLTATYGGVPEGSAHDWLVDAPAVDISKEDFESEWARSRAHLVDRSRSSHFALHGDNSNQRP
jgi:hypothetical protein